MNSRKKVVLFAGTTEGRVLAGQLAEEGFFVVVWTATEYGETLILQELEEKMHGREAGMVCAGRLEEAEMEEMLNREKPFLVLDATHPYAALASENIKTACEKTGIPLIRCLREASFAGEDGENIRCFPDMASAVAWLQEQEGNVLVTTGSKELSAFQKLEAYRERVYARVLPVESSVAACRSLGIEGRHLIAMQGPFSVEMNLAQLLEYRCRFLVTKDGGRTGGFEEKLLAAKRAGAVLVLISRPKEHGTLTDGKPGSGNYQALSAPEVLKEVKRRVKGESL
jgi:precorrin-6x reductase